jgi:hypothetical protein
MKDLRNKAFITRAVHAGEFILLAKLAHRYGTQFLIDNTFALPYPCKLNELNKWVDGVLGPFEAWLALRRCMSYVLLTFVIKIVLK